MSRRVLALLAGLLAMAPTAVGIPASANAPAPPSPAPRAAASGDAGWSGTRSFAREIVGFDGTSLELGNPLTGAPYRMTVHVDHTRNLRGRERVGITWTGAQPSAGRAADPYGANGLNQEYPVVVLQCRGQGAAVRPETCWTSSASQRSKVGVSAASAVWTEDTFATAGDKAAVGGMTPMPSRAECPGIDDSGLLSTHLTPFVTAKGKMYSACDGEHMPPEAAADSAFPPAEIAAFTDTDGHGDLQFEVRSDAENESLGCNQKVACSIVVVPIAGISCDRASSARDQELTAGEKICRKTGKFEPGSFNPLGAPDDAVAPAYWWAASNWRNRFVVPISFGPPPDVCDILDKRAPTGFYGSELLAQAALQWSPAYCLDKDRFKFQMNQMPDQAGWQLMTSGGAAAAEVSSAHQPGADPVGYAPTALTGFGIGYVVDKPGNKGEVERLRLNARLIAKLMTLSYVGSTFGAQHPGMAKNPWAIMADPEFQALNPGLDRTPQEAGAALLSLSNNSDLVRQLTDYLSTDKAATDFIAGKPDPWGMRVNPSYKDIDLPRDDWPLLDSFVPKGSTQCQLANPTSYFNALAAPVTTLRKISDALLDGWPNLQTRCDTDNSVDPPVYKVGRIGRQPYGTRFLLGLVSLGDAGRYGLRTAALETSRGTFVAASDRSVLQAVKIARQKDRHGPFVMRMDALRKARTAYPGTMVVYTAARLQNLPKADAVKVAQFMRVSSTEGQRPGSGNGELPRGFVPIRKGGATAALWSSAQAVADAVERQRVPAAAGPAAAGGDKAAAGSAIPPGAVPAPPAAQAPSAALPAPAAAPGTAAPVAMPRTTKVSSDVGSNLLPLLLLLGVAAAAVSTVTRVVLPLWRRR